MLQVLLSSLQSRVTLTSYVRRLRLVAGEDGGLHRSVPIPVARALAAGCRAAARGCGCAVWRATRGAGVGQAAGSRSPRGRRAHCPGALRELVHSRPPQPQPRRGGSVPGRPGEAAVTARQRGPADGHPGWRWGSRLGCHRTRAGGQD